MGPLVKSPVVFLLAWVFSSIFLSEGGKKVNLQTNSEAQEMHCVGLSSEEHQVLFGSRDGSVHKKFKFLSNKYWLRSLVGALVLIVGGFVLGQAVFAGAATPGTAEDPLVSKSYMEKVVRDKTNELSNQIVALNQRIETLQKALEKATGQAVELPAMPDGYQNIIQTGNNSGQGQAGSNQVGATNPTPQTNQSGPQEGTVNPPGGVNVRYGPSKDYTAITILAYGTKVTIQGLADGTTANEKWYKVKLSDGREGYIRQDLLNK